MTMSGPSEAVGRPDPWVPAVASLVYFLVVGLFHSLLQSLQVTLMIDPKVVRIRGLRNDRLTYGQTHQREKQLYKHSQNISVHTSPIRKNKK